MREAVSDKWSLASVVVTWVGLAGLVLGSAVVQIMMCSEMGRIKENIRTMEEEIKMIKKSAFKVT